MIKEKIDIFESWDEIFEISNLHLFVQDETSDIPRFIEESYSSKEYEKNQVTKSDWR